MTDVLVEKTILIDDSDIDLFIQRRFLEVYNFSSKLLQYKSADEAMAALKKTNDETAPDIIFLDLNMPEVDGFSFLKDFNELPQEITNKCKIVVLTSSNSVKDRELVFENKHVIQFITKPLKQTDIEELRRLVSSRQ